MPSSPPSSDAAPSEVAPSEVADFFLGVSSAGHPADAAGAAPPAAQHTPPPQEQLRRRRRRDELSPEEEAAEMEMKKQKSVQSARDCRRRKKEFIASLQIRVKHCEERETRSQRIIAALEAELEQLQTRAPPHAAVAATDMLNTLIATHNTTAPAPTSVLG